MYLDNERRPTLTPQLAFRVAVIGGVALVMFALIFFRLWYLQVLSGDKYEAAGAEQPRARDQGAGAARGDRGPPRPAARGEPQLALDQGHPGQAPRGPRPARGGLPAARQAAPPEAAPPREADRGRAEGAAVLEADRQAGRSAGSGGLRARAPERVPRRRAGARVPARVPPRARRRAPVRPGRRGERGTAEGPALQRRRDGRPRRPGRHRGRVRPLPQGPQRRGARWRWTRSETSRRRSSASSPSRAAAAPVARPRRPARWPSRRSRAAPAGAPSRSWT